MKNKKSDILLPAGGLASNVDTILEALTGTQPAKARLSRVNHTHTPAQRSSTNIVL